MKWFFIENSQTLSKGFSQSLLFSLLSVSIYFYSICFVFFDYDLVTTIQSTDNNLSLFSGVSVFREEVAQSWVTVIICLCINGFIVFSAIFYYLLYCYEPYRGRRNVLLSLISQNYLFIIFIPMSYFSLFSDKILGTFNAYLTLVIGLLLSRAGGKYQFCLFDHMSKRSNDINVLTVGIMFIGLIIKKSSNDKYTYVSSLVSSLICIIEIWHTFPFFDQKVEAYFFQLSCGSAVWSALILYGSNQNLTGIFIALICTPIFAFKLGRVVYDYRRNSIINYFIGKPSTSVKYLDEVRPHFIDLHVRDITIGSDGSFEMPEYMQSRKQSFYEDIIIKHIDSCKKRPFCFCQQITDEWKVNLFQEFFIGNSKIQEFHNDYVLGLYERYIEEKKKFDDVYISYLFFLMEAMKNSCLAFSKSLEFIRTEKHHISLEQMSILSYIQTKLARTKNDNRVKEVIDYDDQIAILHMQLSDAIRKKNEFLVDISKDYIVLTDIEVVGAQILKIRKDIEDDFYRLYKKNRFNFFLQLLVSVYLVTLSFNDSKLWFEKQKLGVSIKKNYYNSTKDLLYSRKSVAFFVSISKDKLGTILRVSKNVDPVFGYQKEEVIGQNCTILMTLNLGYFHHNLISRFLRRGQLQDTVIQRMSPLVAKRKSGFLIPITMKLEIGYQGVDEIGISSLITVNKNGADNFIALDMETKGFQLRIDGFTENVFHRLFAPMCNFESESDYMQIRASRILPLLPFFIRKLEGKEQGNFTLRTEATDMIAFFPLNRNKMFVKSKGVQIDPTTDVLIAHKQWLEKYLEKGDFNAKKNSLFSVSLVVTFLRDEKLSYCHVQITSFNELNLKDNPVKLVESKIQEQFFTYAGINFTSEQLSAIFNVNGLTENKVLPPFSLFDSNQKKMKNFMSFHAPRLNYKQNKPQDKQNQVQSLKDLQQGSTSTKTFDKSHMSSSKNKQQDIDVSTNSHSFNVSSYPLQGKQRSGPKLFELQSFGENININKDESKLQISSAAEFMQIQEKEEKEEEYHIGDSNQLARTDIHGFIKGKQEIEYKRAIEKQDEYVDDRFLHSHRSEPQNEGVEPLATPGPLQRAQLEIVKSEDISNHNNNNPSSPSQLNLGISQQQSYLIQSPHFDQQYEAWGKQIQSQMYSQYQMTQPQNVKSVFNTGFIPSPTTNNQASNLNPFNSPTIMSPQALSEDKLFLKKQTNGTGLSSQDENNTKHNKLHRKHRQNPESLFKAAKGREFASLSKDSGIYSSMGSKDLNLSNELKSLKDLSLSQSSKGSQDKSLKKIIFHSIEKNQFTLSFLMVKILAILSLLAVASIIAAKYVQLTQSFDKQIRDFYYIPWGMTMRARISRALKDQAFFALTSQSMFSSIPDIASRKQKISSTLSSLFPKYMSKIKEITEEKIEGIVLKDFLTSSQLEYQFYYTSTKSVNMTTSLLYAILVNAQEFYMFQLLDSQSFSQAQAYLQKNFALYGTAYTTGQQLEEESVSKSFDDILLNVQTLLISIASICSFFVIATFIAFSYSQQKKQRILRLFATLEPHKILEINTALIQSFEILFSQKSKLLLSQRQTVQSIKQRQERLQPLVKKKKLISSTSSLPQQDIRLYLLSLVVLMILLIYPITNLIITQNLISQSNTNQTLQGQLQTVKAQFVSDLSAFGNYLVSLLDPSAQSQTQQFARFKSVYASNSAIFQAFSLIITQQQEQSRYNQEIFNDFLFASMNQNACTAFEKYFNIYNEVTTATFSYSDCNSILKKSLANGLLTSIQMYQNIIGSLYQISMLSNAQQVIQYTQFFSDYGLYDINDFFEMFLMMMDTFTSFLQKSNSQFFDQMVLIQTILMVYQFIVLVLTYRYALVRFFNQIQIQIYDAKQILSIFEVKTLYENSYILNYLKR